MASRPLTAGEIRLAQTVYGNAIDYNKVTIYSAPTPLDALGFFTRGRPHAPYGDIHMVGGDQPHLTGPFAMLVSDRDQYQTRLVFYV